MRNCSLKRKPDIPNDRDQYRLVAVLLTIDSTTKAANHQVTIRCLQPSGDMYIYIYRTCIYIYLERERGRECIILAETGLLPVDTITISRLVLCYLTTILINVI